MKTMMELHGEYGLHFDGGRQWGTDKLLKHHYYANDYDRVLSYLRDNPVKLLEIGVYYGASIILWDKYFPNGDITGIDITARNSLSNIEGRVDSNRTRIIIGDAYQKEVADTFANLDIVIDDGPHTYESFLAFIDLYWPKVNKNGVLIIEDIAEESWLFLLKDKLEKLGGAVETIDYKIASDSRILFAKKV